MRILKKQSKSESNQMPIPFLDFFSSPSLLSRTRDYASGSKSAKQRKFDRGEYTNALSEDYAAKEIVQDSGKKSREKRRNKPSHFNSNFPNLVWTFMLLF